MKTRNVLKQLVVTVLSFQAFAQPMEIGRWVTARNEMDKAGVLDSVGTLAPGSIVKIPDAIAQRFENRDEAALNTWLANNGELRLFTQNGETKKDYFFPVEVVDAKHSKGVATGDQVYVSLRFLSRRNALKLTVEQAAPTVAAPEWNLKDKAFSRLKSDLARTLAKVEQKNTNNIVNRRSATRGVVRFNSACPVGFEDFNKEVEEVAAAQRVPAELMLGVMHLESGARCHMRRDEGNGSVSVGLFQINSKTSRIPVCNDAQLQALKGANTVAALKDASLRCLDNPLVNLEEAAQVLRSKYSRVNSRKQPPTGSWESLSNEERDGWRLALAAYNGGEAYVYQAYFDIQDYNQRHGTALNPDDWETRRVFFLRQALDENAQKRYFSQDMRYTRHHKNVMINMAYVESIVGRDESSEKVAPLIAQWIERDETVEFASTSKTL